VKPSKVGHGELWYGTRLR